MQKQQHSLSSLFSLGFRPLFSLMALAAIFGIGLWLGYFVLGWRVIFIAGNPVLWHGHEMLFGFAAAAIGGFLLTASANWAGRPPIQGAPLVLISLAWLSGRLVMIFGGLLNPVWVAAIDLLYLGLLIVMIGNTLIRARNRRNYKIIAVLTALFCLNGLYHFSSLGGPVSADTAIRIALVMVSVMIAIIGGRIVPAFTTNWLRQQNRLEQTGKPQSPPMTDELAIAFSLALAVCWGFFPEQVFTGWVAIIAGLLHGLRMSGWKGWATTAEPLMLVLHIAYGWLALALVALGIAIGFDGLPQSAAIHGLTVGAIGTMILSVAVRVSLGHTGRPLRATKTISLMFILVTLAAVVRIFAPVSDYYMDLILVSGLMWIAAFVLFMIEFIPIYVQPRQP
ncbi:MAG: NnrS family protein [Pseudomonadales bacterium]|nr:NnrS family protein [Pseudomonadales bacterium]